MKKAFLIASATVIGGLLLTSSAMAYMGQGQNIARTNSGTINSNYSTYGVNVVRTVTNISNGAEVTLTTSDSATLEHMKAMFTANALKAPQNTLIKVERTQLSNGTKLTVTSTDANTVKLIQDRAASAKSGLFGNAGQGKIGGKGMKKGQGQGQGKRMGGGQGSCQLIK